MHEERIKALIVSFQGDILFDCHSLSARYGRSAAVRELIEFGPEVVPLMAAHLASFESPTATVALENDLKQAWTWLMDEMSLYMEDYPGPLHFDGWVEWARRRAATVSTK